MSGPRDVKRRVVGRDLEAVAAGRGSGSAPSPAQTVPEARASASASGAIAWTSSPAPAAKTSPRRASTHATSTPVAGSERVERRDALDGDPERESERAGGREADAKPGERPRPRPGDDDVELGRRHAGLVHQPIDVGEHALGRHRAGPGGRFRQREAIPPDARGGDVGGGVNRENQQSPRAILDVRFATRSA